MHGVSPLPRDGAVRIGPGGPSATIEASGTPGTSPACLEDSQERTRPGREGGWPGAGGCVGGATERRGPPCCWACGSRVNAAPKGWGWLERPKPWLEADPSPTHGGAACTLTWQPSSGTRARAQGFLGRNVSFGTKAHLPNSVCVAEPHGGRHRVAVSERREHSRHVTSGPSAALLWASPLPRSPP